MKKEEKIILVTGGAGFMGSNFIKFELIENPNYKIINFDNLTYAGNLKNLKELKKKSNYKFIKGDIANKKSVFNAIKKERVTHIINFAGETSVDKSIKDPEPFIKSNFLGVGVLIEISRKLKIKKFLHISTDEVYGSIKKGSFSENDSLRPNNPYSASKASADILIRSYVKTYNFPAVIVRPSNNFGSYQNREKLIPLFITKILEKKKAPLHGNGKNIREWTYIKDTCKAIKIVFNKGKVGDIYNIGSGEEKSNIEVIKLIQELMETRKNMAKKVKDRLGNDIRYSLNSSKIKELGWLPENKFEESLKKTINWYKENKKWWKNNS